METFVVHFLLLSVLKRVMLLNIFVETVVILFRIFDEKKIQKYRFKKKRSDSNIWAFFFWHFGIQCIKKLMY